MDNGSFQPLDWGVCVVYLVGIFAMGAWFSKRQTDTKEFFVAGNRVHWLPVGISVVVSTLSGISFIGHPALAFRYDSVLIAYALSTILVTPVIIFALLPFYRRLDVISAYEYLEKRFDLNVRLLASALFIGKRLLWMALVALAPSLVLGTITPIPVEYCILIIGCVATVYTGLGGMAAVIWTDVMQFIVLVLGLALIVFSVAARLDGGFYELWHVGYVNHKAWFSMSFDLSTLTFWTVLISGMALVLSDVGADQLIVQRLMATPDESAARKSLIFNAFIKFLAVLLMAATGVGLWVFYHHHPDLLTLSESEYDKIVPFFVVTQLPVGISGLVIAAIFAAAMSSFDSGLNCIVAAVTVDWYERLLKPGESDKRYLTLAKVLTFVLGATITVLSILIYQAGIKSLLEASNRYLGFFGGALLGIFLLGVFTRRSKPLPTVLAAVLAVAVVFLIDSCQSSKEGYFLHPWMYSVVSCAVTMLVGYLGSLLGPEFPYDKVQAYTLAKKPVDRNEMTP